MPVNVVPLDSIRGNRSLRWSMMISPPGRIDSSPVESLRTATLRGPRGASAAIVSVTTKPRLLVKSPRLAKSNVMPDPAISIPFTAEPNVEDDDPTASWKSRPRATTRGGEPSRKLPGVVVLSVPSNVRFRDAVEVPTSILVRVTSAPADTVTLEGKEPPNTTERKLLFTVESKMP